MKRHFSDSQKSLVYVLVGALIIWISVLIIILLAVPEQVNVPLIVVGVIVCLPCIILLIRYRYLWKSIVLDDDGIHIVNKSGNGKRIISWSEVCVFTLTKNSMNGERYICLSSNPDLPYTRTTFGGVYYTMYYETTKTIVLRYDEELLLYCEEKLSIYNISPKYVVNPNTGK